MINNQMNGKVSVIIPVYNAEKYLVRTINFVLAQTYKNFELLLVDDGSKDKSADICKQFAASDERVKYIHKDNGGVSSARNVGIEKATGEYIAFMDDDDGMRPDYLEVHVNNIGDCDLLLSSAISVKDIENGGGVKNIRNMKLQQQRKKTNRLRNYTIVFWELFGANFIVAKL